MGILRDGGRDRKGEAPGGLSGGGGGRIMGA
jgi:hypothetical protein